MNALNLHVLIESVRFADTVMIDLEGLGLAVLEEKHFQSLTWRQSFRS